MKKLMMLFLLVSFMCFGEEKIEPKKSYEVVQREEIDFLKTQLMKSNNKIDDLSKKIEELGDKGKNDLGLTYNVDQIYQNSVQYYDSALANTKWLIERVGGIITLLLGALLGSTWYIKKVGDKELKEKIQKETSKLDQKFNKRINEYNKKMIKSEEKVEKLKQEYEGNILNIKKDVREVQYKAELAIVININDSEEKIEELKKLVEKYPEKVASYIQLGIYLLNEKKYEEAISNFNIVKKLDPEKIISNLLGTAYEFWGKYEKGKNKYIEAKQYFELAIKNYEESIKLDSIPMAWENRIEEMKQELKKLEEKK